MLPYIHSFEGRFHSIQSNNGDACNGLYRPGKNLLMISSNASKSVTFAVLTSIFGLSNKFSCKSAYHVLKASRQNTLHVSPCRCNPL